MNGDDVDAQDFLEAVRSRRRWPSDDDVDNEQTFARTWNQVRMKLTNDINDDEPCRQKQANSVLNVVYVCCVVR